MDQLPADWRDAALLGRLLTPRGPTPIQLRRGRAFLSGLMRNLAGRGPLGAAGAVHA